MTDRETIQNIKHSGLIGIFNKEFIHTGKFDAHFAQTLYDLFDQRM